MALITSQQYLESVKKLKPRVYCGGKWVENLLDNPVTKSMVMANAAIYDLAQEPEHQGDHGRQIPPDGGAHQPQPQRGPQHSRSRHAPGDGPADQPDRGHLQLPLRRLRRPQRAGLDDLGNGPGPGHEVQRALQQLAQDGPVEGPGRLGRHHRRQGRPQEEAHPAG